MATLAQVLDELAATIRDVLDDETDVDVQVEPRMVINPTVPCVDMYPAEPSIDQEIVGFGEIVGGEFVTIRVRVGTEDSYAGQDLLLALMDDEDDLSIPLAIEADTSLNGLASSVEVRSRTGYTLFPDPNGSGAHLGCLFTVEIVKLRS